MDTANCRQEHQGLEEVNKEPLCIKAHWARFLFGLHLEFHQLLAQWMKALNTHPIRTFWSQSWCGLHLLPFLRKSTKVSLLWPNLHETVIRDFASEITAKFSWHGPMHSKGIWMKFTERDRLPQNKPTTASPQPGAASLSAIPAAEAEAGKRLVGQRLIRSTSGRLSTKTPNALLYQKPTGIRL